MTSYEWFMVLAVLVMFGVCALAWWLDNYFTRKWADAAAERILGLKK